MPTRRGLLGTVAALAGAGCLGDDGGSDDTDGDGGSDGAGPSVSSPAFEAGTPIPVEHTCDGADESPPIAVRGTPDGVESLALVVDDPDAPSPSPFVHWLLWNVPPETTEIPAAVPREPSVDTLDGAVQGTNGFDELGYRGPCPPAGDDPHTYEFTVLTLDTTLDLGPGADRGAFESAIDGHVRGESTFTGTYER